MREMSNKNNQVDSSGAAIVCAHVAKLGYPILRAERDKPTMPEDTGWQFLCNAEEPENENEAQVWALSEVLEHEPSLAEFVHSPPGTTLVRDNTDSPWTFVKKSSI
jgi:hypothetical protein